MRRRVGRIGQHQRQRLGDRVLARRARRRAGSRRRSRPAGCRMAAPDNDEAELVDRIGRVGHQDHVARRGDGLRQVGEAFLRPQRGDDLRLGIELHAEAALVIGGLRAAQARDALRGRIAMRARLGDGLDQLVDDVLRRRQVGIAHAEIDDVGAACACRCLQPIDLGEDVGRQTLDAVEVLVHGTPLPRLALERPRSASVNDGCYGAGPRVYALAAAPVQARRPHGR